jgi:hypothetical protein
MRATTPATAGQRCGVCVAAQSVLMDPAQRARQLVAARNRSTVCSRADPAARLQPRTREPPKRDVTCGGVELEAMIETAGPDQWVHALDLVPSSSRATPP